jgi:hypothetical protein
MALARFYLYNEFVSLFNPKNSSNNIQQSAKIISDSIVNYLKEVELQSLKDPVIFLSPAVSIPDPNFTEGPLKLFNPDSLITHYNLLYNSFFNAFSNFDEYYSFIDLELNINSYVKLTFESQKFFYMDYIVIGNVIPTVPSEIDLVFKTKNLNHLQSADLLSEKLHNFFKNCLFTGNYFKDPIQDEVVKNDDSDYNKHISKLF